MAETCYSNFKNQLQEVKSYAWGDDWKTPLELEIPESPSGFYALNFKFNNRIPTLYALQDALFDNRTRNAKFILVENNDMTLIKFARNGGGSIQYIGTDFGPYYPSLDETWYVAYHCFRIFQ